MRQKVAEVGRPNNKSGFLLLWRPYDCVYCVAQPGLPLCAKSLGGQGVEHVRPLSGVRESKEQASHPRTRIGYRTPTETMENCSALQRSALCSALLTNKKGNILCTVQDFMEN